MGKIIAISVTTVLVVIAVLVYQFTLSGQPGSESRPEVSTSQSAAPAPSGSAKTDDRPDNGQTAKPGESK
jgi:hypothetical protein